MSEQRDARAKLQAWLSGQSDEGVAWLDGAVAELSAGAGDRALMLAFSAAPRRVGRALLPERPPLRGVPLRGWSRDQAARISLLLARSERDGAAGGAGDGGMPRVLETLFGAADLSEQVCLYQAMALLPEPGRMVGRMAEGVRSNMLPVFSAVAIGNPYPADWFDEGAWNQMIMKAVFVGRPLGGVLGLERRANPALAVMLVDYARERRAAGRVVTADLWRPAGAHARGERALEELRRALGDADPARQQGAALALHAGGAAGLAAVRAARPDLAGAIEAGRLGWEGVAA